MEMSRNPLCTKQAFSLWELLEDLYFHKVLAKMYKIKSFQNWPQKWTRELIIGERSGGDIEVEFEWATSRPDGEDYSF